MTALVVAELTKGAEPGLGFTIGLGVTLEIILFHHQSISNFDGIGKRMAA